MASWCKGTIQVRTHGKGLYPITEHVQKLIHEEGLNGGMCFLFIPHCSASLCINESYDPSARSDMETFLEQLIPENQPWMRHTLEGGDDSSSHLRALLLPTSLSIPFEAGSLMLGTWQGIYVYEHRRYPQTREVIIRLMAADG